MREIKESRGFGTVIQIVAMSMILVSMVLGGCKNDPSVEPVDLSKRLPTTKWKLESLVIDGLPESELYRDMTLSFTAGNYTSTLGSPVFKSKGTWVWKQGEDVQLDGDLPATVQFEGNGKLRVLLTWEDDVFEPGRIHSLAGEHVFVFMALP